MNILNKKDLIKYIRMQLGEPIIRVELTDDHISMVIDETIGMYTEVVYGDFEADLLVRPSDFTEEGLYLPAFKNIIGVRTPSQARWVSYPLPLSPALGSHFIGNRESQGKRDVQFRWNNIKRVLQLTDSVVPETMIVIGMTTYQPEDGSDHIFNETWVKAMAKAKTQKLWGQILGKFTQNLVGGAQINYDRIISEAEAEIEALREELNDKWVDPAPVMVC